MKRKSRVPEAQMNIPLQSGCWRNWEAAPGTDARRYRFCATTSVLS